MANGILKNRALQDLSGNRNRAQLGAALMESGLSKMGAPGAGKAIGEYLRQEWWRQEANNFQATVGQNIQEQLNQAQARYKKRTKLVAKASEEDTPVEERQKGYYTEYDAAGNPVLESFIPADDFTRVNQHLNEAAADLLGNLQQSSMAYLDAAGQFPNNPIIENSAKRMMMHIQNSFESKLEAAKLAEQQSQMQSRALDMQKKQQELELSQELLPERKKAELAELESKQFDLKQAKITARAEAARGREIAALKGLDPSNLDNDQAIEQYRKHMLEVKEETIKANNRRKKGQDLLPEGVNIHNVGDWLRYSAKGQGVLNGFFQDEVRKAKQDPAIKRQLDLAAKGRQYDNYNQMPEGDEKKAVLEEVLKSSENWDVITADAVKRATSYLIDTGRLLKTQLGLGKEGIPLPLSSEGDVPIRLFESADQMMRAVKPDLYAEEYEEKYEVPNDTPEDFYSGSPDDPYGEVSIPEDSPINPSAQQREIKVLDNYADWLTTFGEDKTMPASVKRKHAKTALKDINKAIENLSVRQTIYGQAISEEQYDQKLAELLSLKANFEAVVKDPKKFMINSELGLGAAINNIRRGIDLMLSEAYAGLNFNFGAGDYANVPLSEDQPRGIFTNKEDAVHGGRPIVSDKIKSVLDAGVPYWMAAPEEKERRQAAFRQAIGG